MSIRFWQIAILVWGSLAAPSLLADGRRDASKTQDISFTVEVDLGRDVGQSFGSLFEARDADGKVIAGAGFADVYNTRFRCGRRTLQFFLRPDGGWAKPTLERLPHPGIGTGVYLCDFDNQTYAWSDVRGNSVRRWDERKREWPADYPPGMSAMRSGDGIMRVGDGVLVFASNRATYNEREILAPPKSGKYYCHYYAQGHLCFYHQYEENGKSVTKVLACEWTPGDGKIDATQAAAITAKFPRATPFVWGQYKRQLITVSNYGGIYVFEDGKWRTVLEADDKTSYQVYSSLHWRDRLLLAQYPTGNVFEYRGEAAKHLKDWPPVPVEVSTAARECQTLGIYGGELMAGVWPWAELWKRDEQRWTQLGRLFSHPALTKQQVHPYEADARRHKLVANHWGQRITSMVPRGDSLLIATSSKGTGEWKQEYKFLTQQQRLEYGAVWRMKVPGNLAVPIKWTGRPMRFVFRLSGSRMTISQDGEKLAETNLPRNFKVSANALKMTPGAGVFGPHNGRIIHSEQTTAQRER